MLDDGWGMQHPLPIVWRVNGGPRLLGKLTLTQRELQLDGTAPEPGRPREVALVQRVHVRDAALLPGGERPTMTIATDNSIYEIELLAGGRGAAIMLIDELADSIAVAVAARISGLDETVRPSPTGGCG